MVHQIINCKALDLLNLKISLTEKECVIDNLGTINDNNSIELNLIEGVWGTLPKPLRVFKTNNPQLGFKSLISLQKRVKDLMEITIERKKRNLPIPTR